MQKALMAFQFVSAGVQLGVMAWLSWYNIRSHKQRIRAIDDFHKFQAAMLESMSEAVNIALAQYEARLEKLAHWAEIRGFTE